MPDPARSIGTPSGSGTGIPLPPIGIVSVFIAGIDFIELSLCVIPGIAAIAVSRRIAGVCCIDMVSRIACAVSIFIPAIACVVSGIDIPGMESFAGERAALGAFFIDMPDIAPCAESLVACIPAMRLASFFTGIRRSE